MARMSEAGQTWEGLAKEAKFDAKQLALLCKLSTRQLQRRFRACLGQSPQQWLNEQRLLMAEKLLLAGLPVKTVTFELGFKQPSHFCRQFKLRNNLTPSEFVLGHVARGQQMSLWDNGSMLQ